MSYSCPFCGAISHHPVDAAERYCVRCHRFADDAPEVYAPLNTIDRIEAVWLFVSEDETGEGVCAATLVDLGLVPLVAADEARLNSLWPIAVDLARRTGKRIKLIRLTQREDLQTIEPGG